MQGKIIGLDGEPIIKASSAYEAAGRRVNSQIHAPSMGPNRAIASAGNTLRNRTRHGYRNSLLLRSAINKNVTSEVGRGFTLLSTCKDTEFKKDINALWKVTSKQLDPWGNFNFGAILKIAVQARKTAGEVFVRRINRRINSGLKVPVQVELYESEMCPVNFNRRLSKSKRIVQGVEFHGRVKVAYWFYRSHPQDGLESASLHDLERVSARDVIHHYFPSRPSQVRAEVETAAALEKDRDFKEYDAAELTRKKERSAFTGFLYREDIGEEDEYCSATGRPLFDDGESGGYDSVERLEAGTMLRGVPGERLELFDGDNTGQGYKDWVRWQSLMLAAGQDIPHALLTGDWSGLNDRLVRAFMNEYRRDISFAQTNLSGFQLALGIWRWFVETAIATGVVSAPNYNLDQWFYLALDIRPDAFKHLHPEQDINARMKAVNSQHSNLESEAAEYGQDLTENMERNAEAIAEWQSICEKHNINPTELTGLFAQPNGGQSE
ncbi:phage portal protein [Pseudoalteromonas luteoviolacea]|uniref:phage portal protein n=1 Tax=Pseudoalteromonas luteoviolacea TaxID=43657 RepID=UPI001F3BEE8D|nr:phage portal protein [Pseudoalteromonas luteoviolacea]MCF6442031.1 phage portal protein [Pseudoalteromonas luteoviolacea]